MLPPPSPPVYSPLSSILHKNSYIIHTNIALFECSLWQWYLLVLVIFIQRIVTYRVISDGKLPNKFHNIQQKCPRFCLCLLPPHFICCAGVISLEILVNFRKEIISLRILNFQNSPVAAFVKDLRPTLPFSPLLDMEKNYNPLTISATPIIWHSRLGSSYF